MAQARSWSTSKVRRSRWLTPTKPGPRGQGAVELPLVVHLDERGQAEILGQRGAGAQDRVVESRHDEQHGISPHETAPRPRRPPAP